MRTKRLDGCRRGVLALAVALPMWLAACSTPTAVSSSSEFEAQEGLVVLRLVDVGNVPISRFTVVSEQTGEEHPLRAIRFGQTVNTTYVGRLPAGRYQPKNLTGSTHQGTMIHSTTVPLAELTGSFDVEASRVTQLGTMVFVRLGNAGFNADTLTTKVRFALPLDPTPVPVEPMLASRFPQLAKAAAGKPPLGWVSWHGARAAVAPDRRGARHGPGEEPAGLCRRDHHRGRRLARRVGQDAPRPSACTTCRTDGARDHLGAGPAGRPLARRR